MKSRNEEEKSRWLQRNFNAIKQKNFTGIEWTRNRMCWIRRSFPSTLSTSLLWSSRERLGLDMTMTPSVSQSSGCLFFGRSLRAIPSFPCSSSMSRSWELLLWKMRGPIFLRIRPSRYMGWTFWISLVRLITDLIWDSSTNSLRCLKNGWLLSKETNLTSRDLGKHSDAIQVQNQLAWNS